MGEAVGELWAHWTGLIDSYTGDNQFIIYGVLVALAIGFYYRPRRTFLVSYVVWFAWSLFVCLVPPAGSDFELTAQVGIAFAMYFCLGAIVFALALFMNLSDHG